MVGTVANEMPFQAWPDHDHFENNAHLQHLFKVLYRLLECHHDLRTRLGHYEADAVVADEVVREVRRVHPPEAFVLVRLMFVRPIIEHGFYRCHG